MKNIQSTECKLSKVSKITGDFWNLLIINQLLSGCKRFGELNTSIPNVTNSTLSDRLKRLAEDGIIDRKQYESIPPKVEYTLTQKGLAMKPIVLSMLKFEQEHL